MYWIWFAVAVAGALGINLVASVKMARLRGTSVFKEYMFGGARVRLLGLPALLLFYLWFYVFAAIGIGSALL